MNGLLSGGLLSAALAMGQTGGTPSTVPPPPSLPSTTAPAPQTPQTPQRGPIMSWFTREDRPVLTRITGWFKRDSADQPAPPTKPGIFQRDTTVGPTAPSTAPSTSSSDFPRRMPNPANKASFGDVVIVDETKPGETKSVVQTDGQKSISAKPAPTPIKAAFANKIGRDEKFAWITGQLELENGVYILYYSSPETVDKYHGRIVLQTQQVDMKGLHRGDLISVQGQIVQRPSLQGMVPAYRLTNATLIERPTR